MKAVIVIPILAVVVIGTAAAMVASAGRGVATSVFSSGVRGARSSIARIQ